MRFSRGVGAVRNWNEMIIAMDTMDRYMDRRSQERKVRSLAQWSRASEVLFSKRRAPESGDERKMWRFRRVCGLH